MKENWKPGTLIYPLPAVLVSCGATPDEYNLLTVPDVLHLGPPGAALLRHHPPHG